MKLHQIRDREPTFTSALFLSAAPLKLPPPPAVALGRSIFRRLLSGGPIESGAVSRSYNVVREPSALF